MYANEKETMCVSEMIGHCLVYFFFTINSMPTERKQTAYLWTVEGYIMANKLTINSVPVS
jgi:hypothetical protein